MTYAASVAALISNYGGLEDGTAATSQLCPACNGGNSGEHSFSIGREGTKLWWKCHRASCGWKGSTDSLRSGPTPLVTVNKEPLKTEPLPDAMKRILAEHLDVPNEALDKACWSYAPQYGTLGSRVVMPIFSPTGKIRGFNLRSYFGHKKKAIIRSQSEEEKICWYNWNTRSKQLVIVEDQPSAVRVAESGIDAVALLGTTLNFARIKEIKSREYHQVYLCLDDDATAKAIESVTKFKSILPQLKVKAIDEDIKNMSHAVFADFTYEIFDDMPVEI